MICENIYKIFDEYSSNTFAGTCNNYMLKDNVDHKTSAIYYKVQKPGKFTYRFCFSNFTDSTWGDGTLCQANLKGGSWKIISAFVGDGGTYGNPQATVDKLVPLCFSGEVEKNVLPGEVFWSDETELEIPENHYLCFMLTFSGSEIPYTPDRTIPSFSLIGNDFQEDKDFPQPVFVGIKDTQSKKIVFLGDSITQGLGTTLDAYQFWVARFSSYLNKNFSTWNLGLGCGHAYDAATDNVWLKKAKTGDIVFVCFGVNDIFMNRSVSSICEDILCIIKLLKEAGCKVFLLSVPPFDMIGDCKEKWYAVNDFLCNNTAKNADGYFDVSSVLGKSSPNSHMSLFGSHPDDNGGRALGKALYEAFCDKL